MNTKLTRERAREIVGAHADEIMARMFSVKRELTSRDLAAMVIAADVRSQGVSVGHACRVAPILVSGFEAEGDVSLSLDQLCRLAPEIGCGKFTRAMALPPNGEGSRRINLTFSKSRTRIGGAG